MWRRACAAAACLLIVSAVAFAQNVAVDTIETTTFKFSLPPGWKVTSKTGSVSARGPAGEVFQLSSAALSGRRGTPEAAEIMRQAEEKVVNTLRRAESNPGLDTTVPLKKTVLPSGVALHEMVSRTKDGSRLFAQFGAIGQTTAILITTEAPVAAEASVDAIREAVVGIRWK